MPDFEPILWDYAGDVLMKTVRHVDAWMRNAVEMMD